MEVRWWLGNAGWRCDEGNCAEFGENSQRALSTLVIAISMP